MPTTTPTIWSGPQTISGFGGLAAQVAALSNGGFAIVSVTGPSPGAATDYRPDLFGQFYGGAGSAIGGNFLSSVGGDFFRRIDAVEIGDGSLAFAATRFDATSAQSDLLIGSMAGPGAAVTTALGANGASNEEAFALFGGVDGKATAFFYKAGDIHSGRFDAGLALSPVQGQMLNKPVGTSFYDGASLANGGLAIVTSRALPQNQFEWQLSFYDTPNGGAVKTVLLPLRFPLTYFALEATKDGRLIVCHNESDAYGFRYQVFASNGDVLVSSRFYSFGGETYLTDFYVAALDDGGFMIAWNARNGLENVGANDPNLAVKVQRFDADGNIVGKPVLFDPPGDQYVSDMETLADGRVLLTFASGTGGDADSYTHNFVILDPRDPLIEGDEGANAIYARLGDSELYGFEGADTLTGMDGDDALDGGAGADKLFGGAGDDLLEGGSGSDGLDGQAGDDTLIGGSGNDVITGGAGADEMRGGGGADVYRVDDAGDDIVERRNGGVDLVESGVSHTLSANVENLTLTGTGAISGLGNALDNTILGNGGANLINGGLGKDLLEGGLGADVFQFDTVLGAANVDVIRRYVAANDVIQLDDAVFAGLPVGALAAAAFNTGSAATDTTDRIIYNTSTGALLFDRDGSGTTYAAVQFATLFGAPTGLGAAEFMVI